MVLFYKVWLIPSFCWKFVRVFIECAIERMKGSRISPKAQRHKRVWCSEKLRNKYILWSGRSFETHPCAMPGVFSINCHSKHEQWPKICSGCIILLWHMRKYLAQTPVIGEHPHPWNKKPSRQKWNLSVKEQSSSQWELLGALWAGGSRWPRAEPYCS